MGPRSGGGWTTGAHGSCPSAAGARHVGTWVRTCQSLPLFKQVRNRDCFFILISKHCDPNPPHRSLPLPQKIYTHTYTYVHTCSRRHAKPVCSWLRPSASDGLASGHLPRSLSLLSYPQGILREQQLSGHSQGFLACSDTPHLGSLTEKYHELLG